MKNLLSPVPKVSPETVAAVNEVAKTFKESVVVTLDEEQIFLLYVSFSGDLRKTAHAAGLDIKLVADMVEKNKWVERAVQLIDLKKGAKPGAVEQELSRAMNFVQCHRYRIFLERVLRRLTEMPTDEILNFLVQERYNKEGKSVGLVFSTRPLADLATAMEKVHWMSYQALQDTPQDRQRAHAAVDPGEISQTDIHARIARALTEVVPEQSPKEQLFETFSTPGAFCGPPEPSAPPLPPSPPAVDSQK